ncbi:hypothetical protein BBJ28_00017506 [Nothophytophthora sp. Chile5]|nr:hypothetical protein BBJ28_00017506 [Nothophytophthora sp. Chile5]
MAMTVLPSFQTFLQSTATPQQPSPLMTQQRPEESSPSHYAAYGASPWHAAAMQLPSPLYMATSPSCSSASETEDDDMMMNLNNGVRRRSRSEESCSGFKRPLTAVGLSEVPLSPTGAAFCATAGKRVKKKYLKERERCEIVRRVRAGEKQAHLAKEFGVSRAAVCYLLKHQIEIMRRSSQRL